MFTNDDKSVQNYSLYENNSIPYFKYTFLLINFNKFPNNFPTNFPLKISKVIFPLNFSPMMTRVHPLPSFPPSQGEWSVVSYICCTACSCTRHSLPVTARMPCASKKKRALSFFFLSFEKKKAWKKCILLFFSQLLLVTLFAGHFQDALCK